MCLTTNAIVTQKQKLANYNIPPARLNIVSPYPRYSAFELNMRRKAQILKYSSSQQNTKSNNLTKKQIFANLVKNPSTISQYQINKTYTNLVCDTDIIKPTLTSSCDVPGKIISLYYDPYIPLYNYGNEKENRSYAISNKVSNAIYNIYTLNIIEYINTSFYSLVPDDITNIVDISYSNQRFVGNLGSIITGKNTVNVIYSFNISTPIAIWFIGSKTSLSGVINNLTISIDNLTIETYFNDALIPSLGADISYSFVDVTCDLSTAHNIFYGIQYVGMLNITNLRLEIPPETIYNIKYVVSYRYNTLSVTENLDFIKTGIFANLPAATNAEYVNNCSISTSMPPTTFDPGSFTQFIVF